jgi:hypothetical protein
MMSFRDLISKSFAVVFSRFRSSPKNVFFLISMDPRTPKFWDFGRAVDGLGLGLV